MSFNQLVNNAEGDSHQLQLTEEDKQYKALTLTISNLIFETNSKVSRVTQYVSWFGSPKDSKILRESVHNENQQIVELFKEIKDKLRTISSFQQNTMLRRARNLEQQKLQRDLQKLIETFQKVQNIEATKSRKLIQVAKQHIIEEQNMTAETCDDNEDSPLLDQNSGNLQMTQTHIDVFENQVLYNSSMIAEREQEIEDIERGIVELNEVFKDLGSIVTDQQSLLDNIESNVNNVSSYTASASNELSTANEYQRKSQKTRLLLIIFLVIIFMVFFLMAASSWL
ncbi:hypothetical protein BB561_004101 [Smittium simulii]|uniref:t-SNARE coiled-coil homology domain-containing protein n=1 Tax=Smittium simulii TaxID=133385 RepID=A0A2T9YI16_9FUNG|nr:hypothetical protein BB561_004101 [Smittium simulii]